MSGQRVHIAGAAMISQDGILSLCGGHQPWHPDQSGPADITRDQVLESPCLTFGKMCLPDKLAFSAAVRALEHCAFSGDRAAILLAAPDGSLPTDLEFRETLDTGLPSPALFAATLPSSPVAEIAIHFGLKGPNYVYAGGNSPLLGAFDTALMMLRGAEVELALVVAVWACTGRAAAFLDLPGRLASCAFALTAPGSGARWGLDVNTDIEFTPERRGADTEPEIAHEIVTMLAGGGTREVTFRGDVFSGRVSLI